MKASRPLLVGLAQVLLLLGLGGRLLLERRTLPRCWLPTAPLDPSLPIRGRYVRLRLEPVAGCPAPAAPVAFFLEENAPDPSRLRPGERLWVEVTRVDGEPPRPIRIERRPDPPPGQATR